MLKTKFYGLFGLILIFTIVSCTSPQATNRQPTSYPDQLILRIEKSDFFFKNLKILYEDLSRSNSCFETVSEVADYLKKQDESLFEKNYSNEDLKSFLKNSHDFRFWMNKLIEEVNYSCRPAMAKVDFHLRNFEEYSGEKLYTQKVTYSEMLDFSKQAVPILQKDQYNPYYLNPKFSSFEFQAGDILVTRGISMISASLATSTEVNSKFSHGVFVYSKDSKKFETIESYINSGVHYFDMDAALKNENARIMIFRNKNKKYAQLASERISEHINRLFLKNKTIPYDYESDYDDHDALTCIEIPFAAYKMASGGDVIIPEVKSKLLLTKSELLSGLNIQPGYVLSPSDLLFDSRFELILDWTDFRLSQDNRNKDAILAHIFEKIEKENYSLQENLTTLAARLIWTTRKIDLLWSILGGIASMKDLPEELPIEQIVLFAKVNKVANLYLKDVRDWQKKDFRVYSQSEIQSWMNAYFDKDKEKYLTGRNSNIHIFFRPNNMMRNQI